MSGQLGGDGTRDYKMPINFRLETLNNRLETNDAINRLQFWDIASTNKLHTLIQHSKIALFPSILTKSIPRWTLICPIDVPFGI